jgi:hypothetical protein
MADEERLTRQDLIYAAQALRVAARVSEKKSQDPTFSSSGEIFARAAESQDALAAKFDRIAKTMR